MHVADEMGHMWRAVHRECFVSASFKMKHVWRAVPRECFVSASLCVIDQHGVSNILKYRANRPILRLLWATAAA